MPIIDDEGPAGRSSDSLPAVQYISNIAIEAIGLADGEPHHLAKANIYAQAALALAVNEIADVMRQQHQAQSQ